MLNVLSSSNTIESDTPFTVQMMGTSYFMLILRAKYYTSIVDRAVSVCSLIRYIMGQSATVMMHLYYFERLLVPVGYHNPITHQNRHQDNNPP